MESNHILQPKNNMLSRQFLAQQGLFSESIPGRIRTYTEPGLNRMPLPIGLQVQKCRPGEIRTHTNQILNLAPLPVGLQACFPSPTHNLNGRYSSNQNVNELFFVLQLGPDALGQDADIYHRGTKKAPVVYRGFV